MKKYTATAIVVHWAMAAGIVGSPTGEAYLRAGYAALGVDVPGHVVAL